jgi:hypothetical protein
MPTPVMEINPPNFGPWIPVLPIRTAVFGITAVGSPFPVLDNPSGDTYAALVAYPPYSDVNSHVTVDILQSSGEWLWPSWKQIPNTGASRVDWGQFAVSAVLINETVYLYTVESDGNEVFLTSSVDGENWSQWSAVKGGRPTSSPAIGLMNTVCAAPDGSLYGNNADSEQIWIHPHPLGNGDRRQLYAWQLVQPVFTTRTGVCVCPSASGSFTPVCVGEAGDIQYLYPGPLSATPASAWSELAGRGKTKAAIAAAAIPGVGDGSFLFLSDYTSQEVWCSTPFFPGGVGAHDPGSLSWSKLTALTQPGGSRLETLVLAAAAQPRGHRGLEFFSQIYLFAVATTGAIWMTQGEASTTIQLHHG